MKRMFGLLLAVMLGMSGCGQRVAAPVLPVESVAGLEPQGETFCPDMSTMEIYLVANDGGGAAVVYVSEDGKFAEIVYLTAHDGMPDKLASGTVDPKGWLNSTKNPLHDFTEKDPQNPCQALGHLPNA